MSPVVYKNLAIMLLFKKQKLLLNKGIKDFIKENNRKTAIILYIQSHTTIIIYKR